MSMEATEQLERMPATARGRILIVEDEAELAEVLEYNLHRYGFTTSTAHDGLAACRLTGSERPDLILLDLLLPDLDGWEICRLIRNHHDREVASTPIIMLTALGSPECRLRGLEAGADAYLPKPYSVKEIALRAGRLINRHRREKALQAELDSLRSEVRMLQDVQGLLCHEYRNHLLIVNGFVKRLAGEVPPGKPADYLGAIARSGEYLRQLAEDFSPLRDLEAGRIELTGARQDLGRSLEEIVALYAEAAADKGLGLELVPAAAPALVLPRAATLLLVSCLLENALKYVPAGGRVRTGLVAAEGEILVFVEDDGPGIKAGERERIFEKYQRGTSASNQPGSGLGLFLARRLCDALGGGIEVLSPASGTRFQVRFPLPPPVEITAAANAGRAEAVGMH